MKKEDKKCRIGDEVILLRSLNGNIKKNDVGYIKDISTNVFDPRPIGVVFPHSPTWIFWFPIEHLMIIKETKEEKEMKLQDLKPNMVVEYKTGERRLLLSINNKLYLIGSSVYCSDELIDCYDDDMKCIGTHGLYPNSDKDIVKVYTIKEPGAFQSLISVSNSKLNLIWEREEPKEMTITELEAILGYSIKIVKEKER